MCFAPFPQAIGINKRGLFRIIKFLGQSCDKFGIVFSKYRILRIRCLPIGMIFIFQIIFGSEVEHKFGCILTLVATIYHNTERYGQPSRLCAFKELSYFRVWIIPGINTVTGIQRRPARAYITCRSIINDLYLFTQCWYKIFDIPIRIIGITGSIHYPTI
ncbi:hypothetical protein D3C72_1346580 [compost metagenome]